MLLWDLQPLTTPDALILRFSKEGPGPCPPASRPPAAARSRKGAVAPVLGRQGYDGAGQLILVDRNRGHVALCAPVLTDDPAGVALRETVLLSGTIDRLPASLGGYKFC